ncbi:hypothetical protein GOP47_0000431 [Adiantum capillus-veneris]|uniref:FLZ-type domain-containing protein n=1 Tax=Adiantum capillus-veneris TaxID=13818 RepID=A0A9D4ZSW3_ADICA|nr:hypothetical protein GOP47_0000431 [Adiantum capillus-veneris]
MPGKRPRPFLRTSSRPQLLQSCGHESPPPPSPVGVKYDMGAPQRVVVGFDVSGEANNTKPHFDPCESPRSVLESDALSDDDDHHLRSSPPAPTPAPSPRSVLDRLLSGPDSRPAYTEGVGLGIVAAISRDEPAVAGKVVLDNSVGGNPIRAISEESSGGYPQKGVFKGSPTFWRGADSSGYEEDHDDDHQESIFCAASPFAHCCSLGLQMGDFLSACFFCKCRLMPGKDIYMYRGDRAFCSTECRYQQIVIDEIKERHSAATNCYHVDGGLAPLVRPILCMMVYTISLDCEQVKITKSSDPEDDDDELSLSRRQWLGLKSVST